MSPPPISINISAPKAANYAPVSPYTSDHHHTLPNTLLCPRYADADATSAPPSPASIESFDILDAVAWRRQGHTSSFQESSGKPSRACEILWTRKKSQVVCFTLLIMFILLGCSLGGFFAVQYDGTIRRDACVKRGGGEVRCESDGQWARCVAVNGLGYCQGIFEDGDGDQDGGRGEWERS